MGAGKRSGEGSTVLSGAEFGAQIPATKNIVGLVALVAHRVVGTVLVNGEEETFIGGSGWNRIAASIGTFFTHLLMSAATPARCAEVGGAAAMAIGVAGLISALVVALGHKIISGDASNGPASRAGGNQGIVIDGQKAVSLAVGTARFGLGGDTTSIVAIMLA